MILIEMDKKKEKKRYETVFVWRFHETQKSIELEINVTDLILFLTFITVNIFKDDAIPK